MGKPKREEPDAGPRHNVNAQLHSLLVPVGELRLDPDNARKHDAKDIAATAASYARHGQQKPLVALEDGTVIAGNGSLVAMRDRLKWTHVAVVRFPDVAAARAYALADNRTAELSSWDDDVLTKQLAALAAEAADVDFALEGTGFSAEDFAKLAAEAADAGGEKPAKGGKGKGGLALDNTNHVRLVQVFLTDETFTEFTAATQRLAVRYDVDNVSDVVLRAVREAAARTE